jgi:uncharacterized protein YktA (UPF0223 family)
MFFLTNFLYGQDINDYIDSKWPWIYDDPELVDCFIDWVYNGDGFFFDIFRLEKFNKTCFMLIRNSIFARHGYKFNSIDLQKYFSQFKWYNGIKTNVDNELTEKEWYVVKFLQQIEENYPSTIPKELIGCWWYDLPDDWWKHHPYSYPEYGKKVLRFFKNGLFEYMNFNGYEGYEYYGLWTFNEGILKLKFLFIYFGFKEYLNKKQSFTFNPNIHHDKYTKSFIENIIFYNKQVNYYEGEVWECNFQENLHSWKKISRRPNFYIPDH